MRVLLEDSGHINAITLVHSVATVLVNYLVHILEQRSLTERLHLVFKYF